MSAHESFLLTEAKRRVAEGERRAMLWHGSSPRPTPRQRVATTLVSLAHRLSPETVPTKQDEPCLQV